jgi:uncharacterized protein YwgA
MKTGNFWWLAAVVAAHDGRRVVGRTRLQKTMKLLQRLGMPTDYLYTMFFYGPYSESLFRDIGRCGVLGLLTEVEHPGPEGGTPTFVLQATPEGDMEEMARWREAIGAMQASDLVVLELAATYDAFREMGSDHAEAVARLKHKKAAKWTEDRHARALALLVGLGLPTV